MASEVASPVFIDRSNFSELQLERLAYVAPLPDALKQGVRVVEGERTTAPSASDEKTLRSWFPNTYGSPLLSLESAGADAPAAGGAIGVVFCGRQAPGGHNIIAGLVDYCEKAPGAPFVVGFIGGTQGLFDKKTIPVTTRLLENFRNQGG